MAQSKGRCRAWATLTVLAAAGACVDQAGPVLTGIPTPDPVAPLPSARQRAWQEQELSAFFHFGMNTFSDREDGDGTENPALFMPTDFNPSQWMTALRSAGFRQAMLTAKHHDGFCLWPSKCTPHSVAASGWQGGQGDVVRDFVAAARRANLRVGLALSPADHHAPSVGTAAYQAVFECQLTELLQNYGDLDEIWLWGGPTPAAPFDWKAVVDLVHRLQPQALLDIGNVGNIPGADVRSVGRVSGARAFPDESSVRVIPGGDNATPVWYPAEAVGSLRSSWFWHAGDDAQVKTVPQLVDLYYNSVGRNTILLLTLQPNTQGLLPAADVAALEQFGPAIRAIYQTNVAAGRPAMADSVFRNAPGRAASMVVDGKNETFWAADVGKSSARLEIDLGGPVSFNVVSLQEPIAFGERTTQHAIEVRSNGAWTVVATGTVIGQRKLHRTGALTADAIALVIAQARGTPALAEISVYQSPLP